MAKVTASTRPEGNYPRTTQGLRQARADRARKNQAREERAKLPENIAARNLRVLKLSEKVEFSMRGYNSDDQGNETRVFQIKTKQGNDIAFALRFNQGSKEISAEVKGKHFWKKFEPNDYTPQANAAIEDQFSKLSNLQKVDPRATATRLAKAK